MARGWTFRRTIGAGFAAMVALTVVVGAIAVLAINDVVSSKDRVINVDSRLLVEAEKAGLVERREVAGGSRIPVDGQGNLPRSDG